jgi:hypothetical protein
VGLDIVADSGLHHNDAARTGIERKHDRRVLKGAWPHIHRLLKAAAD